MIFVTPHFLKRTQCLCGLQTYLFKNWQRFGNKNRVMVSLKAELQKKTTIVKEQDEHREHKITKAKNRNVEL